MKKILTRSTAIASIALSLSGCVGNAPITNTQTGATIGAVLGGVAGNQFGQGEGNTTMTILGTIIGSYIGSQWGAQLDARDRQNIGQSVYTGRNASWVNPNTGYRYNVSPGQVYRTNYNNQSTLCRPVTIAGTIDGRRQDIQTRACQNAAGNWNLVN